MKEIEININIVDGLPVISCPEAEKKKDFGTEWDSKAQSIKFIRPVEYDTYNMMLLFSDGRYRYEADIGIDNTYTITNALTQRGKLALWAYFYDATGMEIGTNKLTFKLRDSWRDNTMPINPMPNHKYVQTPSSASEAITAIRWNSGKQQGLIGGIWMDIGGAGGGTSPYGIGDGLQVNSNVLSVKAGNGLKFIPGQPGEGGTLAVDTVDDVIKDNTQPITSAAVYTEVGNIDVLLAALLNGGI